MSAETRRRLEAIKSAAQDRWPGGIDNWLPRWNEHLQTHPEDEHEAAVAEWRNFLVDHDESV